LKWIARGVVGGYQKSAGGRCPGDQSGKTAAMPAARRMQSYLPGLGMLGPARGGMRRECGAAAALLAVAVLASLVSPSGAAQELRYGTFRWEQVNDWPIHPSMTASFIKLLPRWGQPASHVLALNPGG
jgi:hypothetical protein